MYKFHRSEVRNVDHTSHRYINSISALQIGQPCGISTILSSRICSFPTFLSKAEFKRTIDNAYAEGKWKSKSVSIESCIYVATCDVDEAERRESSDRCLVSVRDIS